MSCTALSFDVLARALWIEIDGHVDPNQIFLVTGLDPSARKRLHRCAIAGELFPGSATAEYRIWAGRFAFYFARSNPRLHTLADRHHERLSVVIHYYRAWRDQAHGRINDLLQRGDAPSSRAQERYLDACRAYQRWRSEHEAMLQRRAKLEPSQERSAKLIALSDSVESAYDRRALAKKAAAERQSMLTAQRMAAWEAERREAWAQHQSVIQERKRANEVRAKNRSGELADKSYWDWIERSIDIYREKYQTVARAKAKLDDEPDASHVRVARRLKIKHSEAKSAVEVARRLDDVVASIDQRLTVAETSKRYGVERGVVKWLLLERVCQGLLHPLASSFDNHSGSAIRLRRKGLTDFEVALCLGITPSRVAKLRSKASDQCIEARSG